MSGNDWVVVCLLVVLAAAVVLGWIAFYRSTGDDLDDLYRDEDHWGPI